MAMAGTGNFKKEMKKNLNLMREYNETTNYVILGDSFFKISKSNKNRWEPLYYAAYSNIIGSWSKNNSVEKEEMLSKAKKYIDEANMKSPSNDELIVLEAFYYQAMIMLDPAKYGRTYSAKATELLHKAQSINKDNPRAQFLLAQNVFYTPMEYGGGKDKAQPLFLKASELFKKEDTTNILTPRWGEETNSEMLLKCSN